jgi:hypothetical protein
MASVIRHNIKHAEPVLADHPPETTLGLERTADLALVLAYVISVSLYLHILSAFALGGFGIGNEFNENVLTTAVIAAITAIGVFKGLQKLEILELWALYITLVIIVLLAIGFAVYNFNAWRSTQGITLPAAADHSAKV